MNFAADHSVTELSRFRLSGMKFDEREVAERFGLEIAHLLSIYLLGLYHRAVRDRKGRIQQRHQRR